MNKHVKLTPGLRAAFAAGRHLQRKDAADPMELLTKKFSDMTDATLEKLTKTDKELQELGDTVVELGKSLKRGQLETKSWGEQVTESKEFKEFAGNTNRPTKQYFDIKAITTGATSGGALGQPYYDRAPVMLSRPKLHIRNLLNVVQISQGSVEYPEQTSRPTGANTVAEGAMKPESNMAFVMKDLPTRVIAHWVQASNQVLEDMPQLRGIIDGELIYGLREKEDEQLLNGNNAAPNLNGIVPQAEDFLAPITIADATMIDTVGLAILQNALADEPADGIVLHPSDWMMMRLLKDNDGNYLLGAPGSNPEPRLFGLPVVESKGIGAGNFLVGAFQSGATLYDRWAPRVLVSSEDRDNFVKNLVTVLAEERVALAVKKPHAFTKGEFEAETP